MAITLQLPRYQTMPLWESMDQTKSEKAKVLQALFDANMTKEFEETKSDYEADSSKFRITDGKVFEIFDSDKKADLPIQVQVIGGTITWYIVGPKDETHQEDRDKLYQAAAVGHLKVKNHCEKYWRGTNSLHVKKMHSSEAEAGLNHNHYRLDKEKVVTPDEFEQHIMGFVDAEREMKLYESPGKEMFLTKEEAAQLIKEFTIQWLRNNHKGESKTVTVAGEILNLPQKEKSTVDLFWGSVKHRFTPEDMREWEENKSQEEPCTSITETTSIDDKIIAIKKSMRGLGAELANTRQVSWSDQKNIATVVKKDDELLKEEVKAASTAKTQGEVKPIVKTQGEVKSTAEKVRVRQPFTPPPGKTPIK